MLDDQRAEILSRVLNDGEQQPDDLHDPELAALIELGVELDRQGANLAFMRQAESEFDPAFARKLRETLVAEYPGATDVRQPTAVATPPQNGKRAAGHNVFSSRTRTYRALLLPFVAAALVITTVNAFLHPSSSPRLATGVAATSTQPRPGAVKMLIVLPTAKPSTAVASGKKPPLTGHVFAAKQGTTVPAPGSHAPIYATGLSPKPTVAAPPTAGSDLDLPSTSSNASVPRPATPAKTQSGLANPTQPAATAVPAFGALISPSGYAAFPESVKLPARLPSLPARADVYSLRYVEFRQAAISKIVASFPELGKVGAGVYRSPDGQETFMVDSNVPNHLTYQSAEPSAASSSSMTAHNAVKAAESWLSVHHLVPSGVNLAHALATFSPATGTVVFSPLPSRGLAANVMPSGILVALDSAGNVRFAGIHWPVLGTGQSQQLLGPERAVTIARAASVTDQAQATGSANGGSGSPVIVDSIDVVYGTAGTGTALVWKPYYRLSGKTIATTGGTSQRVILDVPAVTGGK